MEINPVDKILLTERMRTAMTARRQIAALNQVTADIYESIATVEESVLTLEESVHSEAGESTATAAIENLRHQVSRLEIVKTGMDELATVTHVLLSNMMGGFPESSQSDMSALRTKSTSAETSTNTSTGESTCESRTESTDASTSASTADVEGSIDGEVDEDRSTGDGEV